jgi:transposase InsO family protein
VAADFFTVEVWTRRGLQRFIVLFFIELSTRKVEIAGIAAAANGLWMRQIARNLTDAIDGILNGKRYLIHDRDPLFTIEFLDMVADVGVKSVKLPPRSPTLNAHAERFVRIIKESCLERMIERSRCGPPRTTSSPIITPSAITRGWPTDSSAQKRAILETQA